MGIRREPSPTCCAFGRRGRDRLLTGTEVAKVVSAGVRPNLDVIAATPTAFGLDAQLAGAIQRETVRAGRSPVCYDVVILDTSPAMGLLTYNACSTRRRWCCPSAWSMAVVARQTLDGVDQIRSLGPSIRCGSSPSCRPRSTVPPMRAARDEALDADRGCATSCSIPESASVST
jgi:hypothetical protein